MRAVVRSIFAFWKRIAHAIGVVNTHVLLFLAYWLALGPVSVGLRLFGRDYLRKRRRDASSYWLDREREEQTLERARYQF